MARSAVKPLLPLPALMVMLLAAGAAAVGLYLARAGSGTGAPTPISADAKAYTRNLKLADVEMKAMSSYMGQDMVEITGKISNNGDRPLRQVDLNCVFYDPYSQVVLRERVSIVRQKEGLLQPGQTRVFRLPFDSIPKSWNNTMPQLVIAQILF
ncbi:MAG: DUF2393 domain-containing protein [Acidobacteria bacterium]|nr:DUF2393 domain-containing protein [Acidobacteriota bacterium]